MKILIVDDSRMDRKILSNLLQKGGITNEILQAEDGEKGLEILSTNFTDIGIIMLDWQMPNVDGIEFMKVVVKVPKISHIPIIMITASGSDDNRMIARGANPGLAAYVVKPYKPDELLALVKSNILSDVS